MFKVSGKLIEILKFPVSPGSSDVSDITPLSNLTVLPLIKIESTKAGLVSFSYELCIGCV